MNGRTLALTAIAPALWGTTYVVTTELLPADRPLLAATLRALPAGLALVGVAGRLPRGCWWWRTVVLGTLNFAAFFSLLFTAAYRLPGGVAATVGAVQPLVVTLLAVVVVQERAAPTRLAAAAVGATGVACLVLDGSARLDPVGVAAALGGAVSMATGSLLVQRWGRPAPALTFAGWQLTAGGLLLIPITLLAEGLPTELTAVNIGGFTYLATAGGALAYTLWFRGIGILGARKATFLSLLSPVVATTIGVLRGEAFGVWQLTGAALVLGSVVHAQVSGAIRVAAPGVEPLRVVHHPPPRPLGRSTLGRREGAVGLADDRPGGGTHDDAEPDVLAGEAIDAAASRTCVDHRGALARDHGHLLEGRL